MVERQKFNKGEWSELYVFLGIINDPRLFEANSELNIDKNKFITVKEITREEKSKTKQYIFTDDNSSIILCVDGKTTKIEIDRGYLKKKIREILEEILNHHGRSIEVPSSDEVMKKFQCEQPMALSKNKADLVMSVLNHMGTMEERVGYSIKSMLGGKSTLFNSSQSTNFTYEVIGCPINAEEINSIDTHSKIRDRVKK